ncbi:MAG: aminopeptidase P family protein [Candidatus Gastranaerophilales bacterium]|nr:aminopeptidase P family protein [Candidatus Gastranaerophilales bacterium]
MIQKRLERLREEMSAAGIDFYMIPTADFHHSEYVSDYFKVREYFCGFTGSNGTLLVWREGAGLWTDGRYFIQAQRELSGTGVELFRMQEEGVPTLESFLEEHMREGQTLGFDGRVLSAQAGRKLEERLKKKKVRFCCEKDLAKDLWEDRPPFPAGKIEILPEELAGESVADKLERTRQKVREKGAERFFLSKLDDIMWLFNIRGCDVACNPVAMSYGYVTEDGAVLFIRQSALDHAAERYFAQNHIAVREYEEIGAYLRDLPAGGRVLADRKYCSYMLWRIMEETQTMVEGGNPTEMLKAVKNPRELEHMEEIYLQDSVAVTKFIFWLKNHIGKEEITESTAAEKLETFRRQIPAYRGPSFPTISGYKANAAMMHYEASPEDCAVLKPEGMLLVDSGGQYRGGTTDVTRTIVLGSVTDEEKHHYTLVAMANLRLARAHWLYGCTGRNLDILARQPLWNIALDYKCGTGHGVGYMLNVHEGPHSLRWRMVPGQEEAVLEEGMDVTDEPGVYVEGSHGIRIENVLVVKKDIKNEYGQFMHFEPLTWVPFDLDAILERDMPTEDFMFLMLYQKQVYEKLAPFLSEEEREWLKKETRADSTAFLRMGENKGEFNC